MPKVKDASPGKVGQSTIIMKSGQSMSSAQAQVYQNEGTMETYLLANGYTAAQLLNMGYNDKVYAVRVKQGFGAS